MTAWPTVVEIPGNAFLPPSPFCKGLWFDGQYFWSAESKDTLGKIYRFDHEGHIMAEWTEPAFSGYAACVVPGPMTLSGAVTNGELVLQWRPHPDAAAYWLYGAANKPHFLIEIQEPQTNRIAILPSNETGWTSPDGVGSPKINWTYSVVAMDSADEELQRSNRVGEFDFSLPICMRR